MNPQLKALIYQFICFAVLFIGFRYLIMAYSHLSGYWIPITAFVIATIISPKFQSVRTKDGEKLFMKWMFISGVKEIR